MTLSDSDREIISKEDQILKEVVNSLEKQKQYLFQRSRTESERARDLTSRIVATRRDEEKAMLASDEAVSHALEARNQAELKRLTKQIKKPYFARIKLEEEDKNGNVKEIEYKIGYSANPDCRIIDWKKAPISKLFYEYKEGDDYCEMIQGIERNGRVVLKNTYEIENSELKNFKCSQGNFVKIGGEWHKRSGRAEPDASSRDRMRDVLSLITPEQFRAITEAADTAVLIQGVAGSGKTTVALHRLAWLLDPFNSDLQSGECLVLVQTASLKTYIENTLKNLDVEGIKVYRLKDWLGKQITRILPAFSLNDGLPAPASITRLKRSMALLNCLEESDKSDFSGKNCYEILLGLLSDPERIITHDESKLIDKELVREARDRTASNYEKRLFDLADMALFLRIHQLSGEKLFLEDGSSGFYGHLLIDEVQDTNAVELAAVINSVSAFKDLTVVGDTSQNIQRESTFPGWDRLRRYWDHKEDLSTYIELKISHRSTLQIMKLADYIQGRQLITEGREGRVPIWFKCRREPKGIEAAIKWLSTALERYPNSLTAVLCPNFQEAKLASSLLSPSFGNSLRLASDDSFSFDAGIVVCDTRLVKGLEFFNVLIWNPSENHYPREDQTSRNLLYVGVTRAEENLCIVTWNKPSSFLPDIKSPLVRGFVVSEDDDEG